MLIPTKTKVSEEYFINLYRNIKSMLREVYEYSEVIEYMNILHKFVMITIEDGDPVKNIIDEMFCTFPSIKERNDEGYKKFTDLLNKLLEVEN